MAASKLMFVAEKEQPLKRLLLFSAAAHAVLLLYGQWHDAHLTVKYTDIDYWVFWEAAQNLLQAGDPFLSPVYRYPPIIAALLAPFAKLGVTSGGKIMFSLADLAAGWLIVRILQLKGVSASMAAYLAGWLWLLNPMALTISTRGNAEAVVCSLILLFVYLLCSKRYALSAVTLGVATHVKIFPLLYGITALVAFNFPRRAIILSLRFFAISALTFAFLTASTYYLFGDRGLYSSLLYHLTRRDVRHNFSPYFYPFYLSDAPFSQEEALFDKLSPLVSFLPQLVSLLAAAFKFGAVDFPFACFLQTFCFVTFNKVCTSQVPVF